MDFGRLQNIDSVDFTLPPDHSSMLEVLSGKPVENSSLYVGCPIWTEKGWVGKIFPKTAKEKDFLMHYAQKFNSIELNTTHYRIPDEYTVKRWKEAIGKEFKFCPKVPQAISHVRDISATSDLMKEFCERMMLLEENLGIIFLQLPPYFRPENLRPLLKLLDSVPVEINLAIELRHEDWFKEHRATEELFKYMRKKKITSVITDVAGRRDVLHQRLATDKVLIRFTGNNLHPTDFTRMNDWAERVKEWFAKGLQELYFFLHTPDKSLCPEMAAYFYKQMNIPNTIFEQKDEYKQGSLFS